MSSLKDYLFNHRAWLWPIIALALITPFTPAIDLALSRYYFTSSSEPGFHSTSFDLFMYEYGVVPGFIMLAVSAVMLFMACFFKKWRKWYASSLILVLTLSIGSGLISHAIFKDHWGRPRPKQVIEFGGKQEFRPYYYPNIFHQPEPSKSFPCGHCTMGFYFFALALIGYRNGNKKLFLGALAFAIILGIALSKARIAQGGHFFSHTLASALIMWLTAYTCYYWIGGKESNARLN